MALPRSFPLVALAVVAAALPLGCGGPGRGSAPVAAPSVHPQGAAVTLVHGDDRVGTYVSSPWGFATSSYWIEGPTGVVVIDTQFLPSAAEEMIPWIEASTGKKIALAVVLHPNPDKFNGTAAFQKRGIRVVTSDEVQALIPKVHEDRKRSFYGRYKPDYPETAPVLESFGAKTTTLTAGGVTLKAHVMGAGCSEAHVVVEFDGHLFPGDLVANDAHAWLEIGRTDEWLKRLAEMRALEPRFVHPGRGPSGGAGLLDAQEGYLRKVMAIVEAEKPADPPAAGAVARAKQKVLEAYPGLGFEVFLDIGLPAEFQRQARGRR